MRFAPVGPTGQDRYDKAMALRLYSLDAGSGLCLTYWRDVPRLTSTCKRELVMTLACSEERCNRKVRLL